MSSRLAPVIDALLEQPPDVRRAWLAELCRGAELSEEAKWVENPAHVRVLLSQHSTSCEYEVAEDHACGDCGGNYTHNRNCAVFEAWFALGDRRAAVAIEDAWDSARREDESRSPERAREQLRRHFPRIIGDPNVKDGHAFLYPRTLAGRAELVKTLVEMPAAREAMAQEMRSRSAAVLDELHGFSKK